MAKGKAIELNQSSCNPVRVWTDNKKSIDARPSTEKPHIAIQTNVHWDDHIIPSNIAFVSRWLQFMEQALEVILSAFY